MRQHCPFRNTGGTRSINNGGEFLCIHRHRRLAKFYGMAGRPWTPDLVKRLDRQHFGLIDSRVECNDVAHRQTAPRIPHFFEENGRRDEKNQGAGIPEQILDLLSG